MVGAVTRFPVCAANPLRNDGVLGEPVGDTGTLQIVTALYNNETVSRLLLQRKIF